MENLPQPTSPGDITILDLTVEDNLTYQRGTPAAGYMVDDILVLLASLDGTDETTIYSSKTIDLSGGTSAAPSATGLAAKATLQARSCTVTTN